MKIDKVSIILTIVFLLVSIAPLALGAMKYNWDIQKMISPEFKLPKVDFDVKYERFTIEDGNIIVYIILHNKGEIPIKITGLDGDVLTEDGIRLGTISIVETVYVNPSESKEIKTVFKLEEEAVKKIIRSVLMGARELKIKVKALAKAEVYGVKVKVPLERSFTFPLGTLIPVKYEFKGVRVLEDKIQVVVTVTSKLGITVSDMKTSVYIGSLKVGDAYLEKPVTIEPAKPRDLILTLKIAKEGLEILVEKAVKGESVKFDIKGDISFTVMGRSVSVPIKTSFTYPGSKLKEMYSPEGKVKTEFLGVKVVGQTVNVMVRVTSQMKVELVDLMAKTYFKDKPVGEVKLEKPVTLEPDKPVELTLPVKVYSEAIPDLVEFASKKQDIPLTVKGKAIVRYAGVSIEVPLKTAVKVPYRLFHIESLVSIKLVKVEFKENSIVSVIGLKSNLTFTLESITGQLLFKGKPFTKVEYIGKVKVEEGKPVTLEIPVKVSSDNLVKLIEESVKVKELKFDLDAKAQVLIDHARVTIPLKHTLSLSSDLFKPEKYFKVRIKSWSIEEFKVKGVIEVSASVPLTIKTVKGFVTLGGESVAQVKLAKEIKIKPGETKEITVYLEISRGKLGYIVKNALVKEELPFNINATVVVVIGGLELTIPLSETVTLSSQEYSFEKYFSIKLVDYVVEFDRIEVRIAAFSKLNLTLKSIMGNLTVDGKIIGDLILDREVKLQADKETIITIPVKLSRDGVAELVKRALTTKVISVNVVADVNIDVEGVKVKVALSRSIEVDASKYKLEDYFKAELVEVGVTDTTPYVVFNITSKIPVTIEELKANITLKNKLIGTLILENVELKPDESKIIRANITLTENALSLLVAEAEVEEEIKVTAHYTITLNVAGYETELSAEKSFTLPRENYRFEKFINVTVSHKVIDENIEVTFSIVSKIPLKLTLINITVTSDTTLVGTAASTTVIDIPKDTNKTVVLRMELTSEGVKLLISNALKEEDVKALVHVDVEALVAGSKVEYSKEKTVTIETSTFNPKNYFSFQIKEIRKTDDTVETVVSITNNMSRVITLKEITITLYYEGEVLANITFTGELTIPAHSTIDKALPTTLNQTLLQQLYLEGKTKVTADAQGKVKAEVEGVEFEVNIQQTVEVDVAKLLGLSTIIIAPTTLVIARITSRGW